MTDQMDGTVVGSVTVTEVDFDPDTMKVEVRYWYRGVLLKMN